jgi:Flp pilus assembly protein TadG
MSLVPPICHSLADFAHWSLICTYTCHQRDSWVLSFFTGGGFMKRTICLNFSPLGRLCRECGQGVVEFTFGFLFFYTVLMSIVEFSYMFYTKVTLQHALSEAGRYMVTGQGMDLTNVNPNARLQAVQNKFCNNLVMAGISCTNVASHLTVTCVGAGGCTAPAGGPSQTVTLTATYSRSWFTGMFNHMLPPLTLTANTTWKNEPYM